MYFVVVVVTDCVVVREDFTIGLVYVIVATTEVVVNVAFTVVANVV